VGDRTTKKVHRGNGATTHYGDGKPQGRDHSKNHAAGGKRTMKQLQELLCISGDLSGGGACAKCASPCRFGEEYLKRLKEGETT
jgi:hypothetical protein